MKIPGSIHDFFLLIYFVSLVENEESKYATLLEHSNRKS